MIRICCRSLGIPYFGYSVLFVAACLMMLAPRQSPAQTQAQRITQALLSPEGAPSTPTHTAKVILPHSWNGDRPQRSGIFLYTAEFDLTSDQNKHALALYLPRIGNRYEISVNKQSLYTTGDLNDPSYALTHSPALIALPASVLLAGQNTVSLKVAGEAARYAGVSSIYIGDAEALKKTYAQRIFLHNFSTLTIVICCTLIGFASLLFAYFLKNRHFLIFGLSALCWACSHSYLLLTEMPFHYRIGLFLYDFFYAMAIGFLLLSVAYVIRLRSRWYRHSVFGFVILAFFLNAIYHFNHPLARSVFLNLMLAISAVTFLLYLKIFFTSPRKQSWLMMGMFALSIAFGIYDQFMVYQLKNGYEFIAVSRYAFLMCSIAVAANFVIYLVRVNNFVQNSHARTATKLARTREKLSASFTKQLSVEKERVIESERYRMMQDMHDGLGSQLIGLQHAIKAPNADPERLSAMVKNSITELRLAIKALGQQHTQVSSMLGELRERLEWLFHHQQRTLKWAVDDIPELPSIDHLVIDHLEKIVLELFTNIAKHSRASTITLAATYHPSSHVLICIKEDGQGCPLPSELAQTGTSKGLASIKKRAQAINAVITTQNDRRETTIRLTVL